MRKAVLFFCLMVSVLPSPAQETKNQRFCSSRRGECAGYSSRDATKLSMMGWGLGLGIGIATLCALIPNNAGGDHSHSH